MIFFTDTEGEELQAERERCHSGQRQRRDENFLCTW